MLGRNSEDVEGSSACSSKKPFFSDCREEMGDQYFSFEVHHGGQFVWNPQVGYVGGKMDYVVMSSNDEILSSSPVMPSGLVIDLSDNDEGIGVKDLGADTVTEIEVEDIGDENLTEGGDIGDENLTEGGNIGDENLTKVGDIGDENGIRAGAGRGATGRGTNGRGATGRGVTTIGTGRERGAGSSQPPTGSSSQPVGRSTGRGLTGRGKGAGSSQPPIGSSLQPVGRSTGRGAGRSGKASSSGPVGGPSLATVLQNIRVKKQARVTGILFDIGGVVANG
ncbi:hypothetical protein RHMOL_Rhmol09G0053100 [Rhododendron molle]|uniref:Uncharacterized protein n=1 Tax=Rhododendron molle TaxID=49168 RepID=A0ACC0MB89_RHOML|nr:hypothetical protein RHMOL_Rhmol09G0053100 [Rhododendron molle]